MAESGMHQVDRNTWNKWSFYINIIVFIIIAIFISLLIIDSYGVGKLVYENKGGDMISQAWLNIARDVAFLAIGLTYVFFQLFKYQRLISRRPW